MIVNCIVRGLLKGLAFLHNSSIVHRNVQPASIFLTSDGVPKLGASPPQYSSH